MLQTDRYMTREDQARMNPTGDLSLQAALNVIANPVETCRKIHLHIRALIVLATAKFKDPKTKGKTKFK
jgi:hypothetical protein